MKLSPMGVRAKRFYDGGLWTKEQLYEVCKHKAITPEEYEYISGEPFVPA